MATDEQDAALREAIDDAMTECLTDNEGFEYVRGSYFREWDHPCWAKLREVMAKDPKVQAMVLRAADRFYPRDLPAQTMLVPCMQLADAIEKGEVQLRCEGEK